MAVLNSGSEEGYVYVTFVYFCNCAIWNVLDVDERKARQTEGGVGHVVRSRRADCSDGTGLQGGAGGLERRSLSRT